MVAPFLPFTANTLRTYLNISELSWDEIGHADILSVGHQIGKPKLLFRKIEDEEINKQLDKLEATKKDNEIENKAVNPQKETITYDEFMKMDIRVGTILKAEKVAKADKLLKLFIDTGIDKRTVVSGIAEYHKPEDLIGKQVSILVNLAPRKIRGIESQGMILMAENSDGKLNFISPVEKTDEGSAIS